MTFGSKRKENYTSGPKKKCTEVKEALRYEEIFLDLYKYNKRKFLKITACPFPCKYTEYEIVDHDNLERDFDALDIKFASDEIDVETEEFIYDWISFNAECGGALGLFIGFSFMTLLDLIISCKNILMILIKRS